jgi:hypothetical protein
MFSMVRRIANPSGCGSYGSWPIEEKVGIALTELSEDLSNANDGRPLTSAQTGIAEDTSGIFYLD